MKLSSLEKILISGILPQQGNIKTLTITKDINNKIGLSQKEIKDNQVVFNERGEVLINNKITKEIFDLKFTDLETNEIKLALTKMDKENKLTFHHLTLTEKFKVLGE